MPQIDFRNPAQGDPIANNLKERLSTAFAAPPLQTQVGSGLDYLTLAAEEAGPTLAKYPEGLGTPGPFEKWVLFEVKSARHIGQSGGAEGGGGGTNVKDTTVAAVALYLPESALKSDIEAQYDTNDLGPFGILSEFTAQTNSDFLGKVSTGFAGMGDKIDTAIQNSTGVGSLLSNLGSAAVAEAKEVPAGWDAVKNVFTQDILPALQKSGEFASQAGLAAAIGALGDYGNQMSGMRVNPRTDILFNHIGYRSHTFDFMLIPRNEAEAKTIDNIVHMFQYYMLPSYSPNLSAGVSGMLIGFPYEFTITFWSEGRPNTHHVNKIGRSVLVGASVNHAAAGKNAFFKGSQGDVYPAATSLSLTFKEVRLLSRESEEISRAGHSVDSTNDPLRANGMLPGRGYDINNTSAGSRNKPIKS